MKGASDIVIGVRALKSLMGIGQKTLEELIQNEHFPVHKIRQGNGRRLWVSSQALIREWLAGRINDRHT